MISGFLLATCCLASDAETRPITPSAVAAALDANHDGNIDSDEISRAPQSLAGLDRNGDDPKAPTPHLDQLAKEGICVRGNPQYGKNDFHDNGDRTVRPFANNIFRNPHKRKIEFLFTFAERKIWERCDPGVPGNPAYPTGASDSGIDTVSPG
jgi:hypothetical protein